MSPTTLGAAVRSAITAGANKYFLRATGTAQSVINGKVRLGSTVDPVNALDVVGAQTTTGAGLFGAATLTPGSVGLELQSSTTALLLSRTSQQSITTPVDGMLLYDSTLGGFYARRQNRWEPLATDGIRRLLAKIWLELKGSKSLVDRRLLRQELRAGIAPFFGN